MLALAGGADWIPAMAGSLHPPCRRKKLRPLRPRLTARTALCSVPSSSPHAAGRAGAPVFLPEEKEKTGRARSKREKEVSPLRGDGGRGTRKRCFLRVRMSPARGVVQAGVLEMDEWTSFSFRCRSPGACARLLPVIALEAPPLIARRNGRRHKRLPLIDGPQERGCLPLAFPLSLHLPRGVERQHAAPPVFEENQCYRVSDKKADHRGIFELRYSS